MEILRHILTDIWALTCEMSPYLLLGFLLAGLMHEFVPATLYHRYLSGRNIRSVILAALLGVPLPLCSCGVIPTAMGLRRQGGSRGATISFLIATPQTGVDSIIATYSLMGLPFAIIRPLVALVTAVVGGWAVNVTDNEVLAVERPTPDMHAHAGAPRSLARKIKGALEYAYLEMMEDIGKWLLIGLIIAGLITALVPDSWFALFQDNSLMSILFVLLFSIPMYLCATGSIPIAVALMLRGLTPGAALVLLMAGPASNAASILVIQRVLGRRTLAVYLSTIVVGAILAGLGVDYLLPREWFTTALHTTQDCCQHSPQWFPVTCTVILMLLLINALTPLKLWRAHHTHCHEHECHTHHDEEPTMTVRICGMNCSHCASNAQQAIGSLPGVTHVEVNLADRQAIIRGTVTLEEVRRALSSLGFQAEQA